MGCKIGNKILIVFIICFFILGGNIFGVFASQVEESSLEVQSEHVLTILDELPIDLDILFELDNFTEFEAMLDTVESGTAWWPIKPYGTYWGQGHTEGLPRMDFCPHRLHVEIRAPIDGTMEGYLARNGSIDLINGVECVMDCLFILDIGNECWLLFDHIEMLKTVVDTIENTGNLSLSKGELFGFTQTVYDKSIVDFAYWYRGIEIPPYYAFTPKLQGKVDMMYDFLYERAKLNGLYPRANLINDMFIHKDDEFWGNWYYKTGPYDSYLEEDEWVGHHDFGLLTFLNREFTTSETYWKNVNNPAKNLTDDILGIGGTHVNFADTPGFKASSVGHILLTEGDNTSGIIELRSHYASDWGGVNTSIFGKFEMLVNSTSVIGDELQLEFFATLGEAQSAFTPNMITYYRNYMTTLDDIELPPPPTTTPPSTNEGIIFLYPTIFSFIILSIITRKKKK